MQGLTSCSSRPWRFPSFFSGIPVSCCKAWTPTQVPRHLLHGPELLAKPWGRGRAGRWPELGWGHEVGISSSSMRGQGAGGPLPACPWSTNAGSAGAVVGAGSGVQLLGSHPLPLHELGYRSCSSPSPHSSPGKAVGSWGRGGGGAGGETLHQPGPHSLQCAGMDKCEIERYRWGMRGAGERACGWEARERGGICQRVMGRAVWASTKCTEWVSGRNWPCVYIILCKLMYIYANVC